MTIICAVFLAFLLRTVFKDTFSKDIGATFAILCFIISPMTIALSSIFFAEIPTVLSFFIALLAYRYARHKNNLLYWILASFILFCTLYVRAERGIAIIGIMLVAYCVDQIHYYNWKTFWRTFIICSFYGVIFGLVCFRWLPLFETNDALKIAFIIVSSIWLLLSLAFIIYSHKPVDKYTHIYVALPIILLLLFLLNNTNGEDLVKLLKWFTTENMRDEMFFHSKPFLKYYMKYCGSYFDIGLRTILLLTGIIYIFKKWPGLLVLLFFNILQTAKLNPWTPSRFLFSIHSIVSIIVGIGAVILIRLTLTFLSTFNIRKNIQYSIVTGFILVFIAGEAFGFFERTWNAFLPDGVTYLELYNKNTPLNKILDEMRENIPDNSHIYYPDTLPPLRISALQNYIRINKPQWTFKSFWHIDDFDYYTIDTNSYFVAITFGPNQGVYDKNKNVTRVKHITDYVNELVYSNKLGKVISINNDMYYLNIIKGGGKRLSANNAD